MISNALFIIYTLMCFLGLQAINLVIMIDKHNDTGSTPLLRAARNFIIAVSLLGLFYYFSYYREFVLHRFDTPFLLRGFDASIFYILGYTWVQLTDAAAVSQSPKLALWKKHIRKVFAVLIVFSAVLYTFLLDEYYTPRTFWAEITVIAAEAILGIVVSIYTAVYVYYSLRELKDAVSRIYILLVSLFVCFITVWNNCVVISVYINGRAQIVKASHLYGMTAILLLVINALTIFYFYKKDFSPMFFGKKPDARAPLSPEEALDRAAEEHKLTEREREVMILACRGLSNPDIAEELFISRNTVKRHMHNIFEKLQVSTRMELVHLIQEYEAPQSK